MAADQTPPDEWTSLTCILPDCGEALAVRWELYAPLMGGELAPDADPLVPGDAVAGDWEVRCLNGHVILVPGETYCPGDTDVCGDDLCDHDHDSDLRTWRRSDVDRLTALLRPAGKLPADPDPFDHVLKVGPAGWQRLSHPDRCLPHVHKCPLTRAVVAAQGRDLMPPPGRYQVGIGINDIGDRLLIGDRLPDQKGGTDGD